MCTVQQVARKAIERYLTEQLLPSLALGQVVQHGSAGTWLYAMRDDARESVEGLWVRVVLGLTDVHLVRGILDVPMVWGDGHAVIWAKDFPLICVSKDARLPERGRLAARPSLPSSLTLAIGGPAGSGKTTLIRRLLASPVGERVCQYIAYTTRSKRDHEADGVDYHFVHPKDIASYRKKPRFTGFVEARGHWYWIDPSEFFKARWSLHRAIHVFAITQRHEFLERRRIAPDMKWVWLDASPSVLRQRLERRGDENLERSLAQNARLETQDRTGLVSLHIDTEAQSVEGALQELLDFIRMQEESS